MKKLEFKELTVDDRDLYNRFYVQHGAQCSDYCFSVIQTWLKFAGPVEYAILNKNLLLLKYIDILDNDNPTSNYVLIGSKRDITFSIVNTICGLTNNKNSKVVVTEPHKQVIENSLSKKYNLQEEEGLHDYIYSVDEYSTLDKPVYRRIRREINIHNRLYPNVKPFIKALDITSGHKAAGLINKHHTWTNTYKFDNDPHRDEGLVMSIGLLEADRLNLQAAGYYANDELSGFFIYTLVPMDGKQYADVHHARFDYKYKFMNDYAFHLLALHLKKQNIDYINFERDADILGLRTHKQMLKPIKMIKNYSITTA